jgi:hypothetical protein
MKDSIFQPLLNHKLTIWTRRKVPEKTSMIKMCFQTEQWPLRQVITLSNTDTLKANAIIPEMPSHRWTGSRLY